MKRVIVESPYAGNIELHLRYLRACMADCIRRGEAPYASHALYTQPGVLRDEVPEERAAGTHAGFAWREVAELTVVYTDLGMSNGMKYGIKDAERIGCAIEYRTLDDATLQYVQGDDHDRFRSRLSTHEWGKT